MFQAKFFALALAGVLALIGTGCIVSVEPERAINPVGTEHTVTVTLNKVDEDLICEILEDISDEIEEEFEGEETPPIAIPIACVLNAAPAVEPELQLMIFQIIQGPNHGQNSVENGVCEPSCATLNETTSWTYESNGLPGTDVILACVNFTELLDDIFNDQVGSTAMSPEEAEALLEELVVDAVNGALGSDYETIEDFFCQTAEKTWVPRQERAPNIGAGLSGLFQGQPTPLPTAAAPAAPSPVIRPPNTGDAGLK